MRKIFLGVRSNLTTINSHKLLTESTGPPYIGVDIQTFQLISNDSTSKIENTIFLKSKNSQILHGGR
jgi:hypothetical protein